MKLSVIFLIAVALVGMTLVMFITKTYVVPRYQTFNCDLLLGGWHPDVPQNIQEYCRKRNIISE